MKVKRTEQIWLKPDKNISHMCHLSKNLYNEANYVVRQKLFSDGKWIRYNQLDKMLKNSENYRSLPVQSSQQTLKLLDKNWKSFFRAKKEYKKHPNGFLGEPRIPGYKKRDGEYLLVFTNQQCKIKNGFIRFPSKSGITNIKTRITTGLNQVRIIPMGVGYVCEVIYEKTLKKTGRKYKNRIVGIDIGVRNLVTMINNIGVQPIVVKGGVARSINQYYNKKKAELQSIYDTQNIKNGKRMQKLSVKRERKLNDLFHKISKFVVDWCVEHNIGRIVIGHNDNWKQRVNMGRITNQNFVNIPFNKLTHQISYKAGEQGIEVVLWDESHTSKCSFLDNEPVKHHEEYVGKRTSRGLFRTSEGVIINADVNAGYNIVRKAFPKAFQKWETSVDGIEGVGLHPVRISVEQFSTYSNKDLNGFYQKS